MKISEKLPALALSLSLATVACADWDNPTALSDLAPEVEFEISAAEVETFEEIEVHVHVNQSGAPLKMRQSQLEIQHSAGGPVQVVELEPEGDGYAAHVTFFEPGEHHLHFMGMPERHTLMHEMGEHELDVERRHETIGPYWVELEVSPAPVEGGEGHIHLLIYDLNPDGTPGTAAGGLELELAVHDPDGNETHLVMTEEEVGEYEAEFRFDHAGVYELHVEIEVAAGVHEEGEFHLPVPSETDEETDDGHDDGGHTHGG